MKVTPTTGAVALLLAAGGFLAWRISMNALARLLAALDGITAAVDRVAERLNNTDTVPAADVDNAAARVEDQTARLDALLQSQGGNGGTEAARAHK
jgi:hypothetical protein